MRGSSDGFYNLYWQAPVVIVTDTDWVKEGFCEPQEVKEKKSKLKKKFILF
jgi:hypothetical protein